MTNTVNFTFTNGTVATVEITKPLADLMDDITEIMADYGDEVVFAVVG